MSISVATVRDIAEQVRGVSYDKTEVSNQRKAGYLPILRAGNISEDGLTFEDLVFVPSDRISKKQKLRRNDVVIAASSGSLDVVGKAAQVVHDFDGSFGAFCKVLRPSSKIHPGYFGHFFKTAAYRRRVSELAAGININNLRNEDLDGFEIPLPAWEEQRRIAEVLDRAETLRAKRRAALAQLDTLTESIFLDLFGDPVINPSGWRREILGGIADKITDGEHLNPEFSDSGMPIVMAGNVLDDRVDIQNCKRVDPSLGERFRKKCDPAQGDLLIVSRGATIGRLCIVGASEPFCLMGSVILIKPRKDLIDSHFLGAFLKHPATQNTLYKTSGSSAQQAMYIKDLKRVLCVVPPLANQRAFANRVAAVEKQKTAHRASLAELDSLFTVLQHRAFRGEL